MCRARHSSSEQDRLHGEFAATYHGLVDAALVGLMGSVACLLAPWGAFGPSALQIVVACLHFVVDCIFLG